MLVVSVSLSALASIGGCKITIGGGGAAGNLNLGIPYRGQPDLLLCGPTSVLMWRLYDGLVEISPQQLMSFMGCTVTHGCSLVQIQVGVNSYTNTHDAFLDNFGGIGYPDDLLAEFHARQLQSLSMGNPVIATIEGDSHAVVPNKGNYSTASDGLKRWDFVYVHDPAQSNGGPNVYFSAGAWMNTVGHQVVSAAAIQGWTGSLASYGAVYVRGWSGGAPYDPVP